MITNTESKSDWLAVSNPIGANGGGALTNQYSLVFDLFSPAGSRDSWRTLFQTNSNNSNDGDFFIRKDNDTIGTSSLTYSTQALDEAHWKRLIITFDLTDSENHLNNAVVSYVDGVLFHNHIPTNATAGKDILRDQRYSLDPTLLLLTDNDGDDAPLHVGAVALFDGALTAAEVASLGVAGSPIPEPAAGFLLLGGLGLGLRRRRRN